METVIIVTILAGMATVIVWLLVKMHHSISASVMEMKEKHDNKKGKKDE